MAAEFVGLRAGVVVEARQLQGTDGRAAAGGGAAAGGEREVGGEHIVVGGVVEVRGAGGNARGRGVDHRRRESDERRRIVGVACLHGRNGKCDGGSGAGDEGACQLGYQLLDVGHAQAGGEIVAGAGGVAYQAGRVATRAARHAHELRGSLRHVVKGAAGGVEAGSEVALHSVFLVDERRNARKEGGCHATAAATHRHATRSRGRAAQAKSQSGICGGIERGGQGEVGQKAMVCRSAASCKLGRNRLPDLPCVKCAATAAAGVGGIGSIHGRPGGERRGSGCGAASAIGDHAHRGVPWRGGERVHREASIDRHGDSRRCAGRGPAIARGDDDRDALRCRLLVERGIKGPVRRAQRGLAG